MLSWGTRFINIIKFQDYVENDTRKECLPYTSFNDLMKDANVTNILMRPVNDFFEKADNIVKPLKQTLTGLRKTLLVGFQGSMRYASELNLQSTWSLYIELLGGGLWRHP